VLSGPVSRTVVWGTSAGVEVIVKPGFTPSGTFYVTAEDPSGTLLPAVSVIAQGDGRYTLSLATSTVVAAGRHTGSVKLNLCRDSACAALQAVPSISVPFDIRVMSAASAWPGDNLSALSAWSGVADWSTFQGNAAHTGYVPVGLNPDRFSARWTTTTPGSRSTTGYSVADTLTTAQGQFFFSNQTTLYARREFDGGTAWTYDFATLPVPSVNPPAVAGGKVYVAAGQQTSTYLFGLDAVSGEVMFKSAMSSQWEHYFAPTVFGDAVYTNAGAYGGLYAFDSSGAALYFSGMAQTSMWTPAVDAAGVYSYTGGTLKVVHPRTGAVLHSINEPTFQNFIYEIYGSPVLGAAGSVFAANYANSSINGGAIGNTLIRFDLNTDSVAWQVPGVYPATPAYAAGVLYAVNQNPVRLEARAEADGRLLWSWTPPLAGDTVFASEVLLTNNLAFVSTRSSTYAIDLNTHRPVWSYPLAGRLALSANGIFYIRGLSSIAAFNLK